MANVVCHKFDIFLDHLDSDMYQIAGNEGMKPSSSKGKLLYLSIR